MYKLVLKKGKIELELATTDKELVAKHIALIVNQASNKANTITTNNEQKEENIQENFNSHSIEYQPEFVENIVPNLEQESTTNIEQPIEGISQDNIMEPKEEFHTEPEFKPEPEQSTMEQEQQTIEPQKIEESVVQAQEIVPPPVVPFKPNTINAIQNPVSEEKPNFEEIFNNKIENYDDSNSVILKDSKFIEFVESKSAIEKLDYLVITAQYLAQFENANTFNLKHINAKLMQNFTIIVDHSVLQSAMSKEYITKLQANVDDTNGEYILTEKGLRSY